jgi:hypothetical protein
MATKQTLKIVRGKTVQLVLRWETEPVVSKPITAISLATGFPRLTVPSHGATDGWSGYVTSVQGMKQINAENIPPRSSDYHKATVIDSNTIEFNGLNPVDENGRDWTAHTSGGFFKYSTAKTLTGLAVRVKVKDRIGGTVLLSTEAADAPVNVITVAADNVSKIIQIEIPASATEGLEFDNAVWEVEAEDGTGVVEPVIATSPVVISDEVVTP